MNTANTKKIDEVTLKKIKAISKNENKIKFEVTPTLIREKSSYINTFTIILPESKLSYNGTYFKTDKCTIKVSDEQGIKHAAPMIIEEIKNCLNNNIKKVLERNKVDTSSLLLAFKN